MAKPPQTQKRRKPKRSTPKPPPTVKLSSRPAVASNEVRIVPRTSPGTDRGGGPGGRAWEIYAGDELAGETYINIIDEAPFGRHASIQIYINRQNQGRKIGRTAYRLAAEESAYDAVYAHMRKSNLASSRAAEEAGFVDATPQGATQKVMAWRRTP